MCQKIHMFPVIFIKTEIAAIGAVSQRRIRLPREAHFSPAAMSFSASDCSNPPSLPITMSILRVNSPTASRSGISAHS